MQKCNCPSCGAEIVFQSSVSVSCVCSYCRSLVVRHDKDLEAIGKVAELPQDISPFQLGTSGIYKNIHFSLIGRMKIGWEDGNWNEWFMYTDDGKKGWLAEAQGTLAISFEKDIPTGGTVGTVALDMLRSTSTTHVNITHAEAVPSLGKYLIIDKKPFMVVDKKKATCIASEGELPLATPDGRTTTSIDLLGDDGAFAGIEFDASGRARLFVGEYIEFDKLKFSNLRELEGWKLLRPTKNTERKTNAG